jgi:hypothetical protein
MHIDFIQTNDDDDNDDDDDHPPHHHHICKYAHSILNQMIHT